MHVFRKDVDIEANVPLPASPLVDEILDSHREYAEGDDQGWTGYRNHAQRVFLFACDVIEPGANAVEQVAIAAAFHDLSVFRTLDYLVPNGRALRAWLAERGHSSWAPDITAAITLHHRLWPYRGPEAWLVEPIRRADLAECTLGRWRKGIDGDLVRRARRELPMRRFACRSAFRIAAHAATHPLDPFPFARSKRALADLSRLDGRVTDQCRDRWKAAARVPVRRLTGSAGRLSSARSTSAEV